MTNNAAATGTPSGGTPVDRPTTATVTADQNPALDPRQERSPRATRTARSATTIDYSFIVTNTGNVTLSASRQRRQRRCRCPVCDVTTSSPASSTTCTASHTVTQADLDAGTVTNNASATGTPTAARCVDHDRRLPTVTADQNPALTLDKTITASDPYSTVGATIDYSFIVTNTGNVTDQRVQRQRRQPSMPLPVCDVTTLEPGESRSPAPPATPSPRPTSTPAP